MLWRAYESVMWKLVCVSVEMNNDDIKLAVYVWVNPDIVILSVFTENLHCLAEEKQFYPREEKVERKIAKGSERR